MRLGGGGPGGSLTLQVTNQLNNSNGLPFHPLSSSSEHREVARRKRIVIATVAVATGWGEASGKPWGILKGRQMGSSGWGHWFFFPLLCANFPCCASYKNMSVQLQSTTKIPSVFLNLCCLARAATISLPLPSSLGSIRFCQVPCLLQLLRTIFSSPNYLFITSTPLGFRKICNFVCHSFFLCHWNK